MKVPKTVLLLRVLAVLTALASANTDCDPGFGSDTVSVSTEPAVNAERASQIEANATIAASVLDGSNSSSSVDSDKDEVTFAPSSEVSASSISSDDSQSDIVGIVTAAGIESTDSSVGNSSSKTLFISSLVATGSASADSDATQEAAISKLSVTAEVSSSSANSSETNVVQSTTDATITSTSSKSSTVSSETTQFAVGTASSSALTTVPTTTTPLLPNWVGVVDPSDNACYRKTYISRTCSTGYAFDNIATCWAQCPLNYPVQCGMECIPQSDDCALEVISKVESVATVALNAATSGVFGQLSTASKAVQQGVKCGQQLFTVVDNIVAYAKTLKTNFPNGTEEQIISLLNNSDVVVKDLPTAVCVCLGLNVPTDYLNLASDVVGVVNKVLIQVVEQGSSLLSVDTFKTFMSAIGAGSSVESLDEDDTNTLEKLISKGKTCGTELQSVIAKVSQAVADIKAADTTSTPSAIRLAMSSTALFLTEIPTVTNNCIQNITGNAYTVRDQIRKAIGVITDNLIDSSNGLSKGDYILKVADMGLDVIAMFDPTGIAAMLEEFIQPICGPTSFIGEIDDGSLADALALVADGEAFAGSYGTWTHAGDGAVIVTFESADTEDVTVEIHSAGETIASIAVASGETVTWTSTVSELQDKTMYFDRWRPGLLGLPGSGGGSLVLWVPRSSADGHIELVAKINVS